MLTLLAVDSKSSGAAGNLFFFAIIGLVLIMVLRGNRRRQKAALEVNSAVVPGAEVVTAGGQFGTVVEVTEDGIVHMEVAPGVVVRYVRGAIARVINSPALPEEDEAPALPEADGPLSLEK